MIPHKQTIVGEGGNCWQTVIASLMDLPIDAVPHLVGDKDWLYKTKKFVKEHNNQYRLYEIAPIFPIEGLEYAIAIGPSPRLEYATHAVIVDAKTGKLVHDPHPDGVGIEAIHMAMGIFYQPSVYPNKVSQ